MKNKLLALVLMLLVPIVGLWAQVPPPPTQGGHGGGPGAPDPGTPIDQYTLILFVLAFGLSIYYVLNRQKRLTKS